MDYKKKVEELRAFLGLDEVKDVKLAEDVAKEEAAPVEQAPAPTYVTLEQFNSLKDEQEKFMVSVTEMLSKAMEMINSTEKNTVPVDDRNVYPDAVLEKEVKEEVVELAEEAAEPLIHDPEGLSKDMKNGIPLNPKRRKTQTDIVMDVLWANK